MKPAPSIPICCVVLFMAFTCFFVLCGCQSNNARPREITTSVTDTMVQIAGQNPVYFDSAYLDSFLMTHPRLRHFEKPYREFYKGRSYQYVWYNANGLAEAAYGLRAHLLNAVDRDSAELPYNALLDSLMHMADERVGARENEPDPEAELLLTGMYFYYAEKLLTGVDESVSRKLGWMIPRRKISMPALLDSFLVAKNWDDFERNALNRQYFRLREELGKYRTLEMAGNEVVIPQIGGKPAALKPGGNSGSVVMLRRRLVQLGYAQNLADTNAFLPDMISAVMLARKVYGLKMDTIIDNALIQELNVPADAREGQLLVNMERMRWIPALNEYDELILVNIPDFRLHYFEKGVPVWNCKVVVGTPVNKTVVFSGVMDYVVFSPYWYVPQSIIRNEIGSARARSPAYLRRKNMEWVGGQLRERPGPNNSLGLVKFIFPNSNSIYLHDTPAKALFERDTRAFSHGCIRVEKPFDLAKRVLAYDSSWTDEKIRSAMKAGVEKKVVLQRKIPVYIGYFTAFADRDGLVHFRKDVYNRDGKLLEMLTH